MKIFSIILAVLLTVVLLLGVGLQLFLTRGLTTTLNQRVFPAVKESYGLEMSVTGASVNLFKGTAELNGFTLHNLKGYEEPYLMTFDKCLLEIEMLSLLKRDPVVIKQLTAQGATVALERNRAKHVNVMELAQALKSAKSAQPPPAAAPKTEPAAKTKPIPVHIRRIAVDALVKCVGIPVIGNADLTLRLTGSDLFTIPAEGQPNSLLVLRGSRANDKAALTTDLNAILEPLTDPQHPSFNATGSITGIDPKMLDALLNKYDLESSSISIKPSITSAKGKLKGSYIGLTLDDLKVYGSTVGTTTLKLPINGTLQQPSIDITKALQSLFSEQGMKIGKAIGLRELRKQLGSDTNATPKEALISGLTNSVKEISDSPALQELIQQVAPGSQTNAAATNSSAGEAAANALLEQLGKNVKELKNNEAAKESLKSLGNSLFGK
ncbi:MAG: hypothetical protein IT583_05390 [Verrucomicrobia bacterium]|nr:hypothetical protein [Verrucomicrobiota bacterium]